MNELYLSLLLVVPQLIYLISAISVYFAGRKQNYRYFLAFLPFIITVTLFIFLILQFLQINTSLAIVTRNVATDMNQYERIYAIWSGTEGTLFVWFLFLTIIQLLMEYTYNNYENEIPSVIVALFTTMILISLMFNNPFEYLLVPGSLGYGIKPTLRSTYIAYHPLFSFFAYSLSLYLYAISVSNPRLNFTEIRKLQSINYLIIGLLASAIVSGAFWSNEVLWGGHWTWDPVENLTLMIFLVALLPIHLRGTSRSIQLASMGLTFPSVLFATFVIRSGLLKDPHSYATSSQILFFFLIFVISILPYLKKISIPDEIQININFEHQGRNIWVLSMLIIISTIIVSTLELLVLSLVNGVQESTPKVFYHYLILSLLSIPLIITIFLEFRDLFGMKKRIINSVFLLLLCGYSFGIHVFVKRIAFGLIFFTVIVILPLILVNIYSKKQSLQLKRGRMMRVILHVSFLLLILSFLTTNLSTIYTESKISEETGDLVFDKEIIGLNIQYNSELGSEIYPWEYPLDLIWEITAQLEFDNQVFTLKAGWNPDFEFYTLAATIHELWTTYQLILKFDGFSTFSISNDTIYINLQIRKMFNGIVFYSIELVFPIFCIVQFFAYLNQKKQDLDYYS